MRLPLLTGFLMALTLGCAAAESEEELTASAQKQLDAYYAAVAKIVAKAEAEAAKEKEKALAALTKEKESETKKGNLEGALAIKAKIDALAEEESPFATSDTGTDLLGNPTGAAALDDAKNQIGRDEAGKVVEAMNKWSDKEWQRLPGMRVTVNAKSGSFDTGIALKEGETLLVVPHPTDKWTCGSGADDSEPLTFEGDVIKDPHGRLRWACLYCQMNQTKNGSFPPGLLSGPGKLVLVCNDSGTKDNSGSIRVKILKVSRASEKSEKKDNPKDK